MFRDANGRIPQQVQGPYDGLFSLIGTIMGQNAKQRQDAKMYGDVSDYSKNLDNLDYGNQTTTQDLASRANPNSNYMGKNSDIQAAQGLLPTGFQTATPDASTLGQGLLGQQKPTTNQQQTFFNMPMYQTGNSQGLLQQGNIDLANRPTLKNADGSISTVRSMGINVDGKEVLIPTVGNNGENWTDQQAVDNYKKTGQNLGYFDSPESSNRYAESLHNQQEGMYSGKKSPLMGQYAKENNPSQQVTSAPKTLQEQVGMIKSSIPSAMKELVAKYGQENAKSMLPLLIQAANDKITDHTATYNQNQVNELYQGFTTEENPNKKAMYAARLKNMGYDVTTPYKEFAPDYSDKVVDTGNAQNLLSFDKKSGKYFNGGALNKTVSPDAQLRADTSIKTTDMNNENTQKVAHINGGYHLAGAQISASSRGGRSGGSPKVSAEEKHQSALEGQYVETRTNLASAIAAGDEEAAMRYSKELNHDRFMTNPTIAPVARSDGYTLMNKWNSR